MLEMILLENYLAAIYVLLDIFLATCMATTCMAVWSRSHMTKYKLSRKGLLWAYFLLRDSKILANDFNDHSDKTDKRICWKAQMLEFLINAA